jgi:catechol 2,3-dioxygenase-like lactoylglutathione lyase family enzyme
MNAITPVGIMTENLSESLHFYRQVLQIKRVQKLKSQASDKFAGDILRLESPEIEVCSTETRIFDRAVANYHSATTRLRLSCSDLEALKDRLIQNRTNILETQGKLGFIDLNGINWDLTLN